jgi:superfamily II DNA/RNA helicase
MCRLVYVLSAGSGKTLAYLLPAFAHVLTRSSSDSAAIAGNSTADAAAAVQPRVLVLLPSRELAQQVHAQCTALFSVSGISTAVVYGGVPKDQQVGEAVFPA